MALVGNKLEKEYSMYEYIKKSNKSKGPSERKSVLPNKSSQNNIIGAGVFRKEYQRTKQYRNDDALMQRLSIVNWGEAYQGGQNINNVYYRRSYSAGGNHFVPDNWINSIIIDMIAGLTRNTALPILAGLTARANPSNALLQPVPASQRDFDDFLDLSLIDI